MKKGQRKDAVRNLIDSVPVSEFFSAAQVQEFNALTGQSFTTVQKSVNQTFPDPRHVHCDGDCFSWNSAIDAKSPEAYQRLKVHKSMRDAISGQIDLQRMILPKNCEVCQCAENVHVDHLSPPFHVIADAFIALHGMPALRRGTCGGAPKMEDDIAALWMEYHDHAATYQSLCRKCNSSKGGKQ